jgi:branched-chain amino acid transport system substrate-binding protein
MMSIAKSVALICAVLGFLVGPSFAAETKILKIGAVDSMTGWMAPGEQPANEGAKLAVDWINDNGGITVKGVKYKLQLLSEDSKSSPEGMAAAVTKLVEKEKVKFLIGGVNTVMNISASQITEPAKVFRLGHWACLNPDEIGPKLPLTFFAQTTQTNMRPVLTYLKEVHPEVKTLALTHPGDGAGIYRRKHLEPIANSLGISVVYSEEWPGTTVDFTPVMQKAMASKPDAIDYTDGWAYHVGAQVKAARSLGYKGPIVATTEKIVSEIMQITGSEVLEGFVAGGWDIFDINMKPIMKKEVIPRASARLGKTSQWHPWGWNTLWILTQAIESAQSVDPVVVAKHLPTMKSVETVFGPATIGGEKTFGAKCVICPPQAIFTVKEGKPTFVRWVDTYTP